MIDYNTCLQMDSLPGEEWQDIKNFEGSYQVSSLGRVKGLHRVVVRKNGVVYTAKPYILKPTYTPGVDYPAIVLCVKKVKKAYRIHRLVAEAFIPNPNSYPVVNHKDGNPSNNIVSNLEWTTHQFNINHAFYKLGSFRNRDSGVFAGAGENNNNAMFDTEAIQAIRVLYKEGFSQRIIAKLFNSTQANIQVIVNNKTWNHVPEWVGKKHTQRAS